MIGQPSGRLLNPDRLIVTVSGGEIEVVLPGTNFRKALFDSIDPLRISSTTS
jgi:hypothetical protein